MHFNTPAMHFQQGPLHWAWDNVPHYQHVVSGDAVFVERDGLGEGPLFLLLDVNGHGPEAAFVVECFRRLYLADEATRQKSPADLLVALNSLLAPHCCGAKVNPHAPNVGGQTRNAPEGRYVAALALLFDPATARVRIAGCGELAPVLLLDGSNVALTVEIKGPWLGIFDPYPLDLFHEKIIALRKGDRLVAFTDGVSDALPHGVDQREFLFKKAKLADELVRLAPQAPLPDQVKDFCKQVQDYVRQDWPQDDTTVVIWRAPPGTG